MKFGLKEVANVTFFNIATGKPELYFDTLKVSTIENQAEQAFATGGQGGARLLAWDYNRTSTVQLQDALLSEKSLGALSGDTVNESNIAINGREVLTVTAGAITLSNAPEGAVFVTALDGSEVTTGTVTGSSVTVTGASDGDQVIAYYEYEMATGATEIVISSDKFPNYYKVVGDTFVRQENGTDARFQFVLPKAKLQAGFTLTMDTENVSVFDFNLDVFKPENGTQMIRLIKY